MSVEIEIEGDKKEPPKELTPAEKAKLVEEMKALLGLTGEYKSMSPEARQAALEAIMSKLKGESED